MQHDFVLAPMFYKRDKTPAGIYSTSPLNINYTLIPVINNV